MIDIPPLDEKALSKYCWEKLDACPAMPVPVNEMTERELQIFEATAHLSGLLQFVAQELDPDHRKARALYRACHPHSGI